MLELPAGRPAGDGGRDRTRTIPANSVSRALVRIGDRWSLLIMASAFCGAHRFDDWRRGLGIASNILTNRLNRLTELGCLERVRPDEARRHVYRLTPMGRDLFPTALMFWRFDRLWSPGGQPEVDVLTHICCGQETFPALVCGHCREQVVARDVRFEDGTGAGREPAPPRKSSRRSTATMDAAGDTPAGVTPANLLFGASVDYLGDRWTQLILASFFLGDRRYEQIRTRWLIGTNILADRLRLLVDNGMLRRVVYQTAPERSEYLLTVKGMDIYPIILALNAWGDRYLAGPAGAPLVLTHRRCGRTLEPVVVCDRCLAELDVAGVRFHLRNHT